MDDYKVTDYSALDAAASTANTANTNMNTDMTTILDCKSQLSDGSIFMGPICDSCVQAFSKIEAAISALSSNFDGISNYLTNTSDNYQSADAAASAAVTGSDVGGLGGAGAVTSATTTTTGKANTGNTKKDNVYNYLSSQGLNKAAICGIMANMEKESNFNPNAVGDKGTSYGLCQWHNSRWTNLKNYCKQNNLNADSTEGQLSYLMYELKNNYPKVYNTLKNVPNTAQGAYDAAYAMTVGFEIPANKDKQGKTRGQTASGSYWQTYSSV